MVKFSECCFSVCTTSHTLEIDPNAANSRPSSTLVNGVGVQQVEDLQQPDTAPKATIEDSSFEAMDSSPLKLEPILKTSSRNGSFADLQNQDTASTPTVRIELPENGSTKKPPKVSGRKIKPKETTSPIINQSISRFDQSISGPAREHFARWVKSLFDWHESRVT